MTHDQIYQLTVHAPEPLHYIGRTHRKLSTRKREHIAEAMNGKVNTRKCKAIQFAFIHDLPIEIKLLDTIDVTAPHSSEYKWIQKLKSEGYDLLNTDDGDDSSRYRNTVIQDIGKGFTYQELSNSLEKSTLGSKWYGEVNGWHVSIEQKRLSKVMTRWRGKVWDRERTVDSGNQLSKKDVLEYLVHEGNKLINNNKE